MCPWQIFPPLTTHPLTLLKLGQVTRDTQAVWAERIELDCYAHAHLKIISQSTLATLQL